MPDGDLDPRTRVDKNRDGTLFDNIPGWEQPDPTPEGPGSINNRKLSSAQKRDISKISGEGESKKPKSEKIIDSRKPNKKPRYSAADVSEISDTKPKKEIIKRGEFDFGKKPSKDKSPALSSGAKSEWTETSDGLEMDAPEIDGLYVVQGSKQNGYVVTRYSDGVRNGGVEQTEYEHDEVFKSSASAKKWAEKDLADIANSEDSSTLSSGGKPKKSTRTAGPLGLGGGDNRVDEIGLGGVDEDSRNAYTNYDAKPKKSTGSRNDSELSSGRKPASNRKPTKKNIADGNLVLEKLKIKLKESQDPDNNNNRQPDEYSKYPIIAAIKESEKVINAENRIKAQQIVLDVEKRSKDWRARAEEAYAAGLYLNVLEEEAAYDAARKTFNAMYGSLNTGVDYRRDARFEKGKKDSPLSLSSGANKEWATARGYEPDRFDLRETMNQIGKGNIMAISGGRAERRGNELILPSTKDQQVVIGYSSVPDLYYVRAEQKINAGKDKGSNKILAQWDDVYADELGEIAYQASLKPATLNSENKEYWKLGKDNQFADRLVDRRSGKLVDKDSQNIPAKPSDKDTPTLSSGSRGRDYYKYDIETSDDGDGLLDQIHDSLFENPSMKDDITADIADALGGDGIIEANGFDTERAFSYVTGSDGDFQEYMDMVDDAMDALQNGSLAKHKATVRDTNIRLESLKPGDDGYSTLESLRDRSYEWIGDINKYSRISTIKDKKNIEANDVATRMISKEQDALWNARSVVNEKYIEDITSAKKESAKRRAPIDTIDTDTNEIPDYDVALSSGSVMKDGPLSKTLTSKKDGVTLSSGELKATYDEIGKSILEALIEMDKNPNQTYWDVPWRTPTLFARNPTKKNRMYQGLNQILLAHTHRKNNYRGNFWAGKSQWAKFGGKPKKGENPVSILVPIEGSSPRDYKVEAVFNLDQMEGMPEAYVKKLLDTGNDLLDPATKVKDAESVINEIKPVVKFGGDAAYFSITNDHIQMPPYEMFKSPEGYYSTLLHELTHWTGGKSRLTRKMVGKQQDKKAYSFEELIAEMGSSFLLAALGISPQVRTDHVVYIKGWISNLKEDPGAFLKALKQAQTAADYILDRSPTLRRLSGIPDDQRKGKINTTTVKPGEKIPEDVITLASGAIPSSWRDKENIRYFGDESLYGSGVVERDSGGRILDAAGGLSLSSGAKDVVNLKDGTKVPRLLKDDESYKEAFLGPKDFEPTEQQKAVIDTAMHMVKKKKGSLVIGAGAGSGKTSTMKQVAKTLGKIYPGKKIYYTVFNRGNAKDGNREMPTNTGVATTNQIAYWSLMLGGDRGKWGVGTTKKVRLSASNKYAAKLRGSQRNKSVTKIGFDGKSVTMQGKSPGWEDLGYLSPDNEFAVEAILEQFIDEGMIKGYPTAGNDSLEIFEALTRFSISDDDEPSAIHFGPTPSEYVTKLLEDPKYEFDPKLISVDKIEALRLLWKEVTNPKSNILPSQTYQIKMWALTRPDLRTDPGLIGHRPNVSIFERVNVGTNADIDSGKLFIGATVKFEDEKTGQMKEGVIMALNLSGKPSVKTGLTNVFAKISTDVATKDAPYEIFMFDEAQDINDVMAKVLIDNALQMPIIMVGDSRQAIYAFRGSVEGLSKVDATYNIPLTQSFRYGENIQHLANMVLMRENLADFKWHKQMTKDGVEPGFTPVYFHVKGSASDVVSQTLKITDDSGKRLKGDEIKNKLSFIEKTLTLDGAVVNFDGLKPNEVDDLLEQLRGEHVEAAKGKIVEGMQDADAILSFTNNGSFLAAMEEIRNGIFRNQKAYLDLVIRLDGAEPSSLAGIYRSISREYTLDGKRINLLDENLSNDDRSRIIDELVLEHAPGGADGSVPIIGIPADTHAEFLAFYLQLNHIENNIDRFPDGKAKRPPASKYLSGVWDKKKNGQEPSEDEIKGRFRRIIANNQQARTLHTIAHPLGVDPKLQIGAKGMVKLLKPKGSSYVNTKGETVLYQALVPIRESISIPAMDITGDAIDAKKIIDTGKLPLEKTSRGRRKKIGQIIEPRAVGDSAGEVFMKVHLDGSGNPTGGVIIGGEGAHGGFFQYRGWRTDGTPGYGRVMEGKPSDLDYHGDIKKAIRQLRKKYPDATMSFEPGQIPLDAKALKFPVDVDDTKKVPMGPNGNPSNDVARLAMPAFVIKGVTSEQTAEIVNELGNLVRISAEKGNTDIVTMTGHISKGREFDKVKVYEDFRPNTVPVLSDDQISKIPIELRNKVLRSLELQRRQSENLAYIILTRARRQIDPGLRLSEYYFHPSYKVITDVNGQPKLVDKINEPAVDALQAIKDDIDGTYKDLQIPDDFKFPYLPASAEESEKWEEEHRKREKELDDAFNKFVKSQNEKDAKDTPKKDEVEDDDDGDAIPDPDNPEFTDFNNGPEDKKDPNGGDGDVQSLSLSSGAKKKKKNNRANRRLPYSEQDRQNVADRNILRSRKVPKKRKSGPSKEEFDGPSLSSGANTPSGRYARRLQALSLSSGAEFGSWSNNRDGANATPTNRISGRAFARSVTNSKILAGMRVDKNTTKGELDSAQEFWRGMRKNGIALIASLEIDGSDKKTKISKSLKNMTAGISGVGKKMADRPKVEIGKVSSNQTVNDVDPEKWFVPVSKLMDTIRIPTEFVLDAENRLTFSQTRPISVDELGEMLALDKSQIKKLADPDAGITHDSVRFLLAAIGSEKDFESWSLFSPVQGNELEGGDNAERFVENLGRGNMRDRFIIETFGKEAYPHWVDNEENKIITQDEYVSLGEVSATSKFRATGRFSKKKESEFEARAEYDLLEESMFLEGDTPSDAAKKKIVEDAKPQKPVLAGDKTKKEDFTVDKLLEYLKINKDKNWHNNLKDALQKLNGKEDLGLSSRDIALFWEKNGVPTIYTYEMIRAGLIPDAASVWDEDSLGKRFDGELTASKHAVYEALYEFTEAKHATDRAKNSKLSRSYILGAKDFETAHRDVVAKKGDIFSKKIGDVPRFSQDELQGVVNRFNEIFGTNYKIDDIFSAEQLRTVKERLSKGVSLYTGKNPELGARTILKKD